MLPVLHLNGYKIAGPTVLARIPEHELVSLLEGYGWRPLVVSGSEPDAVHQAFAQRAGRGARRDRPDPAGGAAKEVSASRPRWPMIVLRTPKGWTCPAEVDGVPVEGTWRAHQVPVAAARQNPEHLAILERWLHSYRPEELFDEQGRLVPELRELAPRGERRMSANPHANGGELLHDLALPDFRDYAVDVPKPGSGATEATHVLGEFLRDVIARNATNFRLFGPDETASNRLQAVFEVTDRTWEAERKPTDESLAPDGRVMEVLSEHLCQGWLEGYLLTGRHGLFNCYEAFIHIVDSMFNQHAKWLKVTRGIPWRRPIASLNYLLSSHVWRQDHNGFSHQDPGFIDHVDEQEGGDHPRLSAAGREHAALRRRPLPALAALRERDRRRQAAGARLPLDRRRDRPLHPRRGDLGVGLERRRPASRTSCSPARATCRRWRRSPRPRFCASACRR